MVNRQSRTMPLEVVSGWGLLRQLVFIAIASIAILHPNAAFAHDAMPHNSEVLNLVGFDQRLDAEVPLDLVFRDEKNEPTSMRHYLQDKPVVLALTYFECENLCPMVRHGLVESLRPLAFTVGQEFDVEQHEAITQIPSPSPEMKGKVIDQVEKGYTLGDKVIRFAKVVIGA